MVDSKVLIFSFYLIVGILILIFNFKFSSFFYNLTLYFTQNLNLSNVYLFKINEKNKDSFFFLMRSFVIIFSLVIISISIYYLNI
jgi:hypothetical protein